MKQFENYLPLAAAVVIALLVLLIWFYIVVPQIEVLQTPVGWFLALVAGGVAWWKLRQWRKGDKDQAP